MARVRREDAGGAAAGGRAPGARRAIPGRAGPLPDLGPPRPLPVGAVLKRLGASGVVVDRADLRDALEPAYAAFAAKA